MSFLSELRNRIAVYRRGFRLSGPYLSWNNARLAASAGSSEIYLSKLRQSFSSVLNGQAKYSLDTVLFSDDNVNYALATAVSIVGPVNYSILDFGGGTGNIFFQNKQLWDLRLQKYVVIEQSEIVDLAKNFTLPLNLSFKSMLSESDFEERTIFFSRACGEYVENFFYFLEIAVKYQSIVVLDKFPTSDVGGIFIEHIPERIYPKNNIFEVFRKIQIDSFFENKNYKKLIEVGSEGSFAYKFNYSTLIYVPR